MKTITLSKTYLRGKGYEVKIDDNGFVTKTHFSHATKARKYVRDCFEANEITVVDNIPPFVKKPKFNKRWQ